MSAVAKPRPQHLAATEADLAVMAVAVRRARRAVRLGRYADAVAAVGGVGRVIYRLPKGADVAWQRFTAAIIDESLIGHGYEVCLWLMRQSGDVQAFKARTREMHGITVNAARDWAKKEGVDPVLPPPLPPAYFADDDTAVPPPCGPEERAKIALTAGGITGQLNAVCEALQTACFLFQRHGQLVEIGWVDDARLDGELRETTVIRPIEESRLLELTSRAADFEKWDARAKAMVPARCPPEIARMLLARPPSEWPFPPLRGITDRPMLRSDGSLLEDAGYDAATGYAYLPSETFPYSWGMTECAKCVAEEAAEDLLDLLEEFPFVDDVDVAVALAAIITAVIRPALPTAPMFAFTAPAPGTGKSYLVDLLSMIATGRPASGFTWADDPAENRKALDAALLAGASAITLENVSGPLGGDRLNQVVSQGRATARVLGESRVVEVACNALVTANGNNLVIAADMTRRTLLCRLDAGVERPEQRGFTRDPLAIVRKDRGRYVEAVHWILRGYHLAGRPGQPKPLGSFEAWSSWVRGALLWLGFADPVESTDAVREADPHRSDLLAVVEQWNQVFGNERVSSQQIIAAAGFSSDFREALLAVAGAGGHVNTRRLGYWLRQRYRADWSRA